jgi:PAS domain S-box-containing protein
MKEMHDARLAEVARRENILQHLEHYLRTSPTVTWAGKIEDGRIRPVWVSENVQHILGYSPKELLEPGKMDCHAFVKNLKETEDYIKHLMESGNASREYRLVLKDGKVIWIREEVRMSRSEKHPENIVGTWTEITREKKAELSLAESEARYRSLFEQAPNAVFVNIGNRIALANEACIKLFGGTKPEDVTGHSVFEFFHPDYHGQIQKRIEWMSRTGQQAPTVEQKVLRLDGETVDVEVSTTPFPYKDMEAFHVILHDISDRKEAERKLREMNVELEKRVAERTAELEARNKELETFTFSVSHDLKAPLRGIDGYSRLLMEEHYESLDEESRRFLLTIREATRQMNRLIDDLLDYSRMERRPVRKEPVNISSLVDLLLAEKNGIITEKNAEVKVEIPFHHVRADRDGLALVLRNFLDNALKFVDPSRKPLIEIGGKETDQTWTIWVRDNGIGFDMAFHDRIFGIFQRLHRLEEYEGTGVGLAIVKKAMERMGGRAWAESTPGEGSTFYMEVPR